MCCSLTNPINYHEQFPKRSKSKQSQSQWYALQHMSEHNFLLILLHGINFRFNNCLEVRSLKITSSFRRLSFFQTKC